MSLLTPMLRSSPLTAWFSDAQRVQGMLDFEAALVRAQASCGTVPQDAVAPIVSACQHSAIDFPALGLAAVSAAARWAARTGSGRRKSTHTLSMSSMLTMSVPSLR